MPPARITQITAPNEYLQGINRSIGPWIHAIKIIHQGMKNRFPFRSFPGRVCFGRMNCMNCHDLGFKFHGKQYEFCEMDWNQMLGDWPTLRKNHTPSWDGLLSLLERHQAFFEMTQIASYWSTIVFFSFCWTFPCFIPLIIPCLEATLAASHCQS